MTEAAEKQELAETPRGGQEIAHAGDTGTSIIQVIERAAKDPNVDPDKMERMFNLYERTQNKIAEQQYAEAMSKAQSEMGRISADASNPQTKSRYASYAALDRELRPIYSRHGFSLSFDTDESPKESHVRVLCYVSHVGGFTRIHKVDMSADGKGAKGGDAMTKTHAEGSAMSYGMRYLLKLIFNVAVGEDDDDGNGAGIGDLITEDQAADIEAIIDELDGDKKTNRTNFLNYLSSTGKVRIASVSEIPAKMHKDALAALEAKRKGEAKRKST